MGKGIHASETISQLIGPYKLRKNATRREAEISTSV
jgi:hypothetical protein